MHIVTGATKLCSISKLYDDAGWETFKARQERQKLIIFFKMVHCLSPAYLNQLVPDLVQNRSPYLLRNSDNMSTIHTNSVLYCNSPSAVRSWNNLPNESRTSTSVIEFKRKLSEHRNKPLNYFYYGSRVAQIYHARLRLECSALRHHLLKKNLVESPNCLCGSFETSKHFLFECPNCHQICT